MNLTDQDRIRLFASSCKGKVPHATRELAEQAARNLKREKLRRGGYVVQIYACRFGNHWHVGRTSTKLLRRRRKGKP